MRQVLQGVAFLLLFILLVTGCELAGEGETRYTTAEDPFYVGEWMMTDTSEGGYYEYSYLLRFTRSFFEYKSMGYSDTSHNFYSYDYKGYVTSTDSTVFVHIELVNLGSGWLSIDDYRDYRVANDTSGRPQAEIEAEWDSFEGWEFILSEDGEILLYDNGDGTFQEHIKITE